MNLKVVTFNTQHGIIDPKIQSEVLKKYNPDIILLQEIDMYNGRSDDTNQLEKYVDGLDLKFSCFGSNISYQNGWYGNAIISKYEILFSSNYKIELTDGIEDRGVLLTKINAGGKILNVLCTHFPTDEVNKVVLATKILNFIKKIPKDEYIILGGDLNSGVTKIAPHQYKHTYKEKYEELEIIEQILYSSNINKNKDFTFPTDNLEACIDYIYCSKNIKTNNYFVIKENISDHYPVCAELEI